MNRETVIESYILKMSIETRASSSHARMFIYEFLEMLDRADNNGTKGKTNEDQERIRT